METCAGCADPVVRGEENSMNLFCAYCKELADELGIDLSEPDKVSAKDLATLANNREAYLG